VKVITYQKYGSPDVLEITEQPRPTPGDNELLIRVRATTVSSADWRMRSLEMPRGFGVLGRLAIGIRGPRKPVLGSELAGDVEAVGRAVTSFKVGDQVFAFTGAGLGCHAEYKCLPANGAVALKPSNLSFEQAAALSFGGATILDYFRRGELRSGERVLVNGASGTVGSAAVQLARHFGAHVTGVCSAANLELVRSIGADEVIDYTQRDFAQSKVPFDVIVDTVGNAPFARSGPALRRGGRLLLVLASLPELLKAPWHSLTSGKRVIAGPAAERPEYVRQLGELALAGRFTPVIDRSFPFENMVDAHRYVDRGHKRGSVVITLGPSVA
jgi:NADPH:quinone reductase-like Zn-dependent oxidoreductase